MPKEWAISRPTTIYKPLKQIELLALSLGWNRGHRTCRKEPPDTQTLRSVLQRKPRVNLLNYARWSPTVKKEPPDTLKLAPDASGAHRSCAQRVLQTHDPTGLGAPDAHRTRAQRGLQTALTPDAEYRTHSGTSGALSENLSWSQATPDARIGNTLRPVLNPNRARHWQHTGRSGQRSVPLRTASGEWETLPRLLQISHRHNRKYTLNFLKNVESRRREGERNPNPSQP